MPKVTIPTDLPPNWEARDVGGRIVYINHETRTTQWEKPRTPKEKTPKRKPGAPASAGPVPGRDDPSISRSRRTTIPPLSTSTSGQSVPRERRESSGGGQGVAEGPLPEGWDYKIINGKKVYIDHVNQRTSFERPPGPAGTSNAPQRVSSGRRGLATGSSFQGSDSSRAELVARGVSGGAGSKASLKNSVAAGDGESPLPPGWGRSVTPLGEVYYVNHVTKTTTWSRPTWTGDEEDESLHGGSGGEGASVTSARSGRSANRSHAGVAESQEGPLPSGWEERMSSQGKKFYINHNDKTTHWERPPPPAPGNVPSKGSYEAGSPSSPNYTTPFATSDGSRPLSVANSTGGSEEHIETATPSSGGGHRVSAGVEEATAASQERLAEETADGDDDGAELDGDGGADEPVTDSARAPYSSVRTKSVTPPVLPLRPAAAVEDDDTADASSGHIKRGALSVLSSGMFGATVNRPGSGGVGGDSSSWNGSSASSSRGVTPIYASNAVTQTFTGVASGRDYADELPPGWIKLKTPAGKTYYQNSIAKTTQWQRPVAPKAEATTAKPNESASVPEEHVQTATYNAAKSSPAPVSAFQKVMTADGRPYYQNSETRETTWRKPAGWVDPDLGDAAVESDSNRSLQSGRGTDGMAKTAGLADEEAVTTAGGAECTSVHPEVVSTTVPTPGTTQSSPDPQDPPLPPGWEKLYTEDGIPFWTNHNERTTSWDPPPANLVHGSVSETWGIKGQASMDSSNFGGSVTTPVGVSAAHDGSFTGRNLDENNMPLPEGWEMQRTEQGIVYYVDHISKRTSWDPPQMSTDGTHVVKAQKADIPPAELVPDSADLYLGADLLNRFFSSWTGDAGGKSPLEGARNVIVTALTGTQGLKVTKGRNGTFLQRYLYLGPTNKQIVWASRSGPRGRLAKKGIMLDNVTSLCFEGGTLRVESRGESAPLILKSAELPPTLTSEGGSILLGVLLADMTGNMLKLDGVNGSPACYYPASFVKEVLRVRQAREDAKAAATAAQTQAVPEQEVTQAEVPEPEASADTGSVASSTADAPAELSALPGSDNASARGSDQWNPAAAGTVSPDVSAHEPEPAEKTVGESSERSIASEGASGSAPLSDGARTGGIGVVAAAIAAAERGAFGKRQEEEEGEEEKEEEEEEGEEGGGEEEVEEEEVEEREGEEVEETGGEEEEEEEDRIRVDDSVSGGLSAPAAASSSDDPPAAEHEDVDTPEAPNECPTEEEPVVEAPKVAEAVEPAPVREPEMPTVVLETSEASPADAAPAVEGEGAEAAPEAEENEEDEETREYRAVLVELLRPVKLEHLVDNFLQSEITLDILPLVERKDLETVVGIAEPVPQLKIMKQIKRRFPNGI